MFEISKPFLPRNPLHLGKTITTRQASSTNPLIGKV